LHSDRVRVKYVFPTMFTMSHVYQINIINLINNYTNLFLNKNNIG